MPGFICEERLTFGPWQSMERALARLVEHSGFRDVVIVGGSGDKGADIIGTHKGQRWVIQSKYRRSGTVGRLAAEEAIRAMTPYKATVAVAATNQAFSPDALDYWKVTKKNGIDLRLWNGDYLLKFFRALPEDSSARRSLRAYQDRAVNAIEEERSKGNNRALAVLATGLGKSIVASELVRNELARNPRQEILVLAHTTDLTRQLEASFWPQLGKSHSTHLWTDGECPSYCGGVVFATWQSLHAAMQTQPLKGRFGLIVVDEAHHAPSSAFSKLLSYLNPNFMAGMTATPWRGDEKSVSEMFGRTVYSMDVVDGMQCGFLAEVDYRMLTDGIDWNEVACMSRQGLTVRDLNQHLIMPERDMAVVEKFAGHYYSIDNPRALMFCRSIDHAERLKPLLYSHGISAAVLHSKLSREERFFNLSSFRVGHINVLLSVEMLNEGIDVPDVNLVAFMRVTHSRRIFIQQLGRGLRMQRGKDKVLVLDFVADIRRVAAGFSMNREASQRGNLPEVLRFRDGRIVQFGSDFPASFFDQYLADVADIENMDEGASLRFPDV